MERLNQETGKKPEQTEQGFYKALDQGIDDMENGRILPHEDVMQMIRESVKNYDV